jgi:hypothetical protein
MTGWSSINTCIDPIVTKGEICRETVTDDKA